MKKKIRIILGIGLTLVLTVTLAIGLATPVPAADYPEDEWGIWGLPCLEWDTDVGPMAVAPDGTLYAAVRYYDDDVEDYCWKVMKSEDDGYTWDDTQLCALLSSDFVDNMIVSIVVSPNYEEDETVYMGTYTSPDGPTVYRLEEAGEASAVALKAFPSWPAVDELYCIDVWFDGDDNWVLAGTDEDVFVIRDAVFGDWIDQDLDAPAYEVNLAPDFEDSELIWAVTESGDGDFLITSTRAPGWWGQVIGEAEIDGVGATMWVDLDFPDDYDSDPTTGQTIVYVGLSSPDGGDVYLIEGVDAEDDPSNAIALVDLAGDYPFYDLNINSIAVSGDYGEEVILAGELDNPYVWISDDGGDSWDTVDKHPTGETDTHVIMEADVVWGGDVFDTDDGVAFASTVGDESAVSRSDDGGLVWNQVGLIDTEIADIDDLAFHPDFPDEPIFLMITDNLEHNTSSLWLTENGDEEEPDYIRVLCGHISSPPGNFEGDFWLVEFSQDASRIYIHGEDDDGDASIWRSYDHSQTFCCRRHVRSGGVDGWISDWVITEDDTIYAAVDAGTDDGFHKTTNSGLSWSATSTGGAMNDICLQPDFDADDDDFDAILLGGQNGEVMMSNDGGDSFDNTGITTLTQDVFVAFDANYADEDADGYKLIYACDNDDGNGDNAIIVGEEDGTDTEWDPLEDDTNKDYDSWITGDFFGLVVADDDALYAIADSATYDPTGDRTGEFSGKTGVVRLLLHETNSLWEEEGATDLTDPEGLWLTYGSNVLWTINEPEGYDDELWVLEDTVQVVEATIDIEPDTLNLKSKGKWITAYIELPEGYDVADIDATTVLLNDTVPAVTDPKYDFVTDPSGYITDKDGDGILERMVKFDRSAVQGILGVGDAVEITVTGEVAGTLFDGSDIIRVK